MKLIVQIPCLNEANTLPAVVAAIPASIPGIDTIEILVIDDGSTDGTVAVARQLGVHHVLQLGSNRGLATAFARGLHYALAHGANIIVNTDGDNQYQGADIPQLLSPILANQADIVVGARPIREHPEFSLVKKALQRLGTFTLRRISRTPIADSASGFRAFSREAAQRLFLHTGYSHCLETLIQAGNSGLRVMSVPVRVNRQTRPSRLFRSLPHYLYRSGLTTIGMFVVYRPGRFFLSLALLFGIVAAALGARYIFLVFLSPHPSVSRTYVPSLILLSICGMTGVLFVILAIVGELIGAQRRVAEEILFNLKRQNASNADERPVDSAPL